MGTPGDVAYVSRDLTVERTGDLLRMAGSPGIAAAYTPEGYGATNRRPGHRPVTRR